MVVTLLTVLMVAGANQPVVDAGPAPACQSCQPTWDGGSVGQGFKVLVADWFGPMPQTCYSPRFGCYPGNTRDIQRYPAFHGNYYGTPYNYRRYFDYPWHAEPHEPQAHFTQYEGPVGEGGLVPMPDPAGSLPAPVPAPLNDPQAKVPSFGKARLLGR